MRQITVIFTFMVLIPAHARAQQISQTVQGQIIDGVTEVPLVGANVRLLPSKPILGASTDHEGKFSIDEVPLGNYTVEVSYLGYETSILTHVKVNSGKALNLRVRLTESILDMNAVVVSGSRSKASSNNDMTLAGARSFTVDETRRYAGGFDDPARLATAFAGVTGTSIAANAIVVRGNAPKGVQWRIEGVEVPNPSHLAGADIVGGGIVTLLSNHVLGNSDFLTAAFPAEYGNALSGVFDLNFRTGNPTAREHTFQAGLLGIDIASEGPFNKEGKSTYLLNYRYSTLGLLMPLLPEDANQLTYQDLSFKLHFPSNLGNFSIWGIGGNDFGQKNKPLIRDSNQWEVSDDFTDYTFGFNVGAAGISHQINLSQRSLLKTVVYHTLNHSFYRDDILDGEGTLKPNQRLKSNTSITGVSTTLRRKWSTQVTSKTGLVYSGHRYRFDIRSAQNANIELQEIAKSQGFAGRWQAYHQMKYWNQQWSGNAGLHSQFFQLTNEVTIEPRLSLRYRLSDQHSFSGGYGKHSQLEPLRLYFILDDHGRLLNQNLDLTVAHHYVFGYDWNIGDNHRLKIEPYYQMLDKVPVAPGSAFSMINFSQDWSFDRGLKNTGKGKNYGIDLTVEKFLSDDWYYLISGSWFRSKYLAGDQVWRNSRYDRRLVFNVLTGKEWELSNHRRLGINFRYSGMGGERITPLDELASIAAEDEIYQDPLSYSLAGPNMHRVDVSLNYRKNRPRASIIWSLQVNNIMGAAEFEGYEFNYQTRSMQKVAQALVLPNLSYKIEF